MNFKNIIKNIIKIIFKVIKIEKIETINTRWISSMKRIKVNKNKVLAILGNKYILELKVIIFETPQKFVMGESVFLKLILREGIH
jgi:hypothetical protein